MANPPQTRPVAIPSLEEDYKMEWQHSSKRRPSSKEATHPFPLKASGDGDGYARRVLTSKHLVLSLLASLRLPSGEKLETLQMRLLLNEALHGKKKLYKEGGDTGNHEDQINELVSKMN
ncbi:60S ribosomal protein L7-1 [Camellia lanceoleosa]|uniref:60S ribosomal protein L7-1 n=1 Tax=Camellia lanceoleosa TaxID=1840588 RepID=A0ACC0I9C5_9ERIC|nr:60S ribosomal protein L7-1 [Camellia lanceoleosa]